MAPITTFIKISPKASLPLRIFINRKSIIKQQQKTLFEAAVSSANTTNHRALVRLKSTTRLMISNRQIRDLVTCLKDDLIRILFENSIGTLLMINEGGKENLKISVSVEGWDVNVSCTMKYLVGLRGMLKFGTFGSDGMELLVRKPRDVKKGQDNKDEKPIPGILQEDDEMGIPEEGEFITIPDSPKEEKKSDLKYDYKNCIILGKGINLEVLKIPRN